MLSAPWKIVGFVVTPTTPRVRTSSARLPDRMRSRDRSSSQTDTPAAANAAMFSFCAMSCYPFTFSSVRCAAATTASSVKPNSRNRVW
ncbi:Uncharacterised protein [Mycobacteroides abscessus subsp. abscessus]|nr:Uncharacterised protein [Mycobacteroides abscessus subsp. abscessus]